MGISKTFSSKYEYTMSYSGMRGVDFSDETNTERRDRFAYLENMYRDYESEGGTLTESIPGFRKIFSTEEYINNIYLHKHADGQDVILVHAGGNLYGFYPKAVDTEPELFLITTLRNIKSCGFNSGSDFYVMDGRQIIKINEMCEASVLSESELSMAYVPTAYVNGIHLEDRNLLTDKFLEEFTVGFPEDYSYQSDGLLFRITDHEKMYCELYGTVSYCEREVYVPKYTLIGNSRYRVTAIADGAFFQNSIIKSIHVAEGCLEIGNNAISSMTSLKSVYLPDSIQRIGKNAFANCEILSDLRLGASLVYVDTGIFTNTPLLYSVNYARDEQTLLNIENMNISGKTVIEYSSSSTVKIEIPVFSTANWAESVMNGSERLPFTAKYNSGSDVLRGVVISGDKKTLEGMKIVIHGIYFSTSHSITKSGMGIISNLPSGISPAALICGCTVSECFDGRVFISGHYAMPNTILYSSRDRSGYNNPFYFGIYNYFNDGVGSYPVVSMLAAGSSLAVFKAGDDGAGSIYYHTPSETGIDTLPKIYPVNYVHSGIPAIGETISFFDDPIFVSSIGISSLDKMGTNLERSISCRSSNVNSRLLCEELEKISLARWCGYLAVLASGRIYLADSRQRFRDDMGRLQYEWYYLSGIGTYKDDYQVFRYSPIEKGGFLVHENADEVTDKQVLSTVGAGGEIFYYTEEDGVRYSVYRTSERRGGTFSPAIKLLSTENDLLFFGTESGDICLFNNDKRGAIPDTLTNDESFDEENYKLLMGRRIHPEFYSFAGHAPKYTVSTVCDDCDMPHFTKSTVKNSLTARIRCFGRGELEFEVETNVRGHREIAHFTDSDLDFSNLDFSAFSFYTENRLSIPTGERERGWCEKRISVSSESYNTPLGIYSLTYRFTIKGPVKKKISN